MWATLIYIYIVWAQNSSTFVGRRRTEAGGWLLQVGCEPSRAMLYAPLALQAEVQNTPYIRKIRYDIVIFCTISLHQTHYNMHSVRGVTCIQYVNLRILPLPASALHECNDDIARVSTVRAGASSEEVDDHV
jgi:hypothetical protein